MVINFVECNVKISASQVSRLVNFGIVMVHCLLILKNTMISRSSASGIDLGYNILSTEAMDDLYLFKVEGEKWEKVFKKDKTCWVLSDSGSRWLALHQSA